MSRHLDKVLAHAETQLATTSPQRPTELLPQYRRFLKIEEHRLRLKHLAGSGGRDICSRRADLVDVILRQVFEASAAFSPSDGTIDNILVVMALGGYGRGELNPSSDIDVMFLHGGSDRVSPYVERMVEQVLYLLWDVGFKVGHSTRSLNEALALANQDMLTKTAMLESRAVAGSQELAMQFREKFRLECIINHESGYIRMRMADQRVRHAKHGNTVYVLEPHVKSGCGGLRDYQNLLWMTYFSEGVLTTTHLVGKNWMSESDQKRIEAAYDFLLRVRTDLHYVTKRATDILHLNLQEEIARRLGYPHDEGLIPSEALMKDYYEHTRNILRVTERITEQFAGADALRHGPAEQNGARSTCADDEQIEAFTCRNGRLAAPAADLFRNDPEQMMRAFAIAQERHLDFSPELEDLISRSLALVNRTYRYATKPRELFEGILRQKGRVGRILRMMHRLDFLGSYMPEFGQLTCLVQHEYFHRYTADEHTLVCIEMLDALAATDDPKLRNYRKLFEELEDPLVLYLALLLHDTGRAVGARPHSEASAVFAQRAAMRLQLPPEQRKMLILLVDHHITLSNTAQQRNLDDPATINDFANIVKNQTNLDALMLLTLADGRGTSPDAWSDWKESLVWQLYHATTEFLADQHAYYEQHRIERESLQRTVSENLSPDFADEVDAHFDYMPDRYFRTFGVSEISHHAKLFRTFFENIYSPHGAPLAPAVAWHAFPDQGNSIVTFVTWDRPQLLSKIAGSFSVVPINILSADVFARGDNLALQVFRVANTRGQAVTERRDIALVEHTLRAALASEDYDFRPLLDLARAKIRVRPALGLEFPTRVVVDNKTHPSYTLIEVHTPDRVGLLYQLLACLGAEGIRIALSRISTVQGAAIDIFYVNDSATRGKITDAARIDTLQKCLQQTAVARL